MKLHSECIFNAYNQKKKLIDELIESIKELGVKVNIATASP